MIRNDHCNPNLRLSALTLLLFALSPVLVRAQAVIDPTRAEFTPSSDHTATLSDGTSIVDHYELEFYLIGAAQPFQAATLGKPAPDSDGTIRVSFASVLSSYPAPGIMYDAAITAVGPSGIGRSSLSNTFSFSVPCSYTVSPTSQSVVAGGGGANATVTAGSGCSWTAASNVSWITVSPGSSGSGNGTVSYTVAANASTTSRSGTLTVAGRTVTVTQTPQTAPAAPLNLRITT